MKRNDKTKWPLSTLLLMGVVLVCVAGTLCGVLYLLSTSSPPQQIPENEEVAEVVRTVAPQSIPAEKSGVPRSQEIPVRNAPNTPAKPDAAEIWEATAIWPQSTDTIMIRRLGLERLVRVRLAGIHAPERATREAAGHEPWGTRAHQHVVVRVSQHLIRFELDPVATAANDDRPTGYLWLGDTMLNQELLETGLVAFRSGPSMERYVTRLQNAQKQAISSQLGIWDRANPWLEAQVDRVNTETVMVP